MKVTIERTKSVKPFYKGNNIPTDSKSHFIPLSVFDKVSYNTHVAVIFAYNPPTPTNATIEHGLQKVLSDYREWAGRLGEDENAHLVIFLNDKGVNFVEASIDIKLERVMPLRPSPFLLSLHPKVKDVEELLQVQLTRFACGSLVIGFTAHHLLADGHSASHFSVAWGKATRGLELNPLPLHDRTIFKPRNPPFFEFEHEGVEFKSKILVKECSNYDGKLVEEVEVHKVHFTTEFLSKLKARASKSLPYEANGNNKPYTIFESLVAHLWRTMTKARELNGYENTRIKISVNGRARMNPKVPNEYFGNMVLWAYPSSKVKDLVEEPLGYAAELIHNAIETVNDKYFKSFIDFATLKAKEEELVPTADVDVSTFFPNLKVDSWLRFPFYELDFGGGNPCIFMPSYIPIDGFMFLLPSCNGDGSADACITLFRKNMDTFKQTVLKL